MSNSRLRRPPNATEAQSSCSTHPEAFRSTLAPTCVSSSWQPTIQATSQPPIPTASATCLWFSALVLCLLTIMFATGVAVYLAFPEATPPGSGDRGDEALAYALGNRYREVLDALWAAGNGSFDPCQDFYLFACYKYRPSGAGVFTSPRQLGGGLLGFAHTDPGRALFIYYRSCTAAQYNHNDAPQEAVRALFETFGLATPLTRLGIFSFILKANLKYGVHGSLTIVQYLYGFYPRDLPHAALINGPLPLYVLALPGTFSRQTLSLPSAGIYLRGIVGELRRQLETNLTLRQLELFSSDLHDVSGGGTRVSDVGALGDIVPGVSARLWKDTVEACTSVTMSDRVYHSPLRVLVHRFRILLDERHPVLAVALIVTEMAFDLLQTVMDIRNNLNEVHEFCTLQSLTLMPLWVVNALLLFGAKTEHNQALMTLFDLLKETIATEVMDIVDPRDASLADSKLRNLSLALPYHVFPPDLELPNLGAHYLVNILRVREYRLTSKRYRTPQGVLQSLAYANDVWVNLRTPGFIYIPATVYSAMALDHKMVLLRGAVMGFLMADLIWSDVFETQWTQQASVDRLTQAACNSGVPRGSWIKRPHLALGSCLRVTSRPGWHDLRYYLGPWHFSLSQVFYRLVAYHYYCYDKSFSQPVRRRLLSDVTTQNRDFYEAYGCPGNVSQECALGDSEVGVGSKTS